MSIDGSNQASWLSKPLCRRYIASTFEVASFKCGAAAALRKRQVEWAFGWLPDGECEGLGAWLRTEPEGAHGGAVVDDLKIRGVERLLTVEGTAPHEVPAAFCSRTPRASIERLVAQALEASDRHGLPSPARITTEIAGSLDRAIRRHGAFDDEAEAVDFIAAALQRAERRLDRERQALMRHLPLASSVRPLLLAI
jgi:hypothetical protein